tara:strand:- start:1616 stop:3172 length:1557 start_codon:yes stop_codon:yes gene_type:complete
MPNYKYTAAFDFEVNACEEIAGINIAKANIENLKSLIPTSVDLKKNIDLMGVAFNAAVVNEFNKNGDGISTATAIESVQQFVHKPTNIEHDKKKIVGHIVNAGFSSYADSTVLINVNENETDPFNIALGAVVYKTVDKEFFETLQKSTDPKNKLHNSVSASWEVGFSDYKIAVGSKNLKDAEIISDPNQINEMRAMLKGFGGKGVMDDGTPIYRLIVGNVYPLGIGFTMKPAANVKGVISENSFTPKTEKETEAKLPSNSSEQQVIHLEKINDEISHFNKKTVNTNNIMDLETLLSEIKASLTEKKFSEEAIAGMTSTFADAIKQKDDEYKASLEAAENEKAEIAAAREELQASVESIKEELASAQERISEFEQVKAAQEAETRFNSRMEEIDSIYDLEESDSSFIAEKLKGLDSSEEAFASLKSELEVFWSAKNKEAKAKFEEEVQARVNEEVEKRLAGVVEASEKTSEEKTDVEAALDNAEATTTEIPNNNEAQASEKQTLRDRFAAAFSRENILK